MTLEESNQVASYIASLNSIQAQAIRDITMQFSLQGQQLKRQITVAREEKDKMVAAMIEIEKQAKSNPCQSAEVLQANILAIITYYCQDYEIPF